MIRQRGLIRATKPGRISSMAWSGGLDFSWTTARVDDGRSIWAIEPSLIKRFDCAVQGTSNYYVAVGRKTRQLNPCQWDWVSADIVTTTRLPSTGLDKIKYKVTIFPRVDERWVLRTSITLRFAFLHLCDQAAINRCSYDVTPPKSSPKIRWGYGEASLRTIMRSLPLLLCKCISYQYS